MDLEQLKIKPEEIKMQINDRGRDLNLIAWVFSAEAPRGVVIQFHGNGENISSHFRSLYWVVDQGFHLMTFDYPGYGGSEGSPTPENTVQAGEVALRTARLRWPKLPVVVVGQSIGGAVALQTLLSVDQELRQSVDAVVIESSFDSYQSVARSVLAKNWFTWPFQWISFLVLSDKSAPRGRIGQIEGLPLLILHEDQDPVVPHFFSNRIFNQAKDPKKIKIFTGKGHAQAFYNQHRVEARRLFLELFQMNKAEP